MYSVFFSNCRQTRRNVEMSHNIIAILAILYLWKQNLCDPLNHAANNIFHENHVYHVMAGT